MTAAERILEDVDTWIFDLDNTLYSGRFGFFDQVSDRMTVYIAEFLGLGQDQARALQKQYFIEHGTTLNGLMKFHDCDPEEFLAFVHDIDWSPIPENPELARALADLPGRNLIFTNGDQPHAQRAMERLGIAGCFEAVFDIVASGYIPKPDPVVYQALIRHHDIDPGRAIYFEDIARNLKPAKDLGMTTVLVGDEGDAAGDHIDHHTPDLTGWLAALIRSGGASVSTRREGNPR